MTDDEALIAKNFCYDIREMGFDPYDEDLLQLLFLVYDNGYNIGLEFGAGCGYNECLVEYGLQDD